MNDSHQKRVHIQSDYEALNQNKNQRRVESVRPSEHTFPSGRPKLKDQDKRTKYIKIYCTEEEKERLVSRYGSSSAIRNHLLEANDER